MNTTRKGTRWVKKVDDWLVRHGFQTRRTQWMEPGDDITARLYSSQLELSVEGKDHAKITLAAFVDQAERNAGDHQVPLCVVKRRGKTEVDDAYIVMSGRAFADLLRRLR